MINDFLAYFKQEEYQNELRGHLLNPRVSKEISNEVEQAKKDNLTSSRIGQIVRTWKPYVLAQE